MTGGRALQFRPNVLDAPGALDVAIVEFLMLWPEDEARRSKAMEAAVIRHLTELRGLPIPRSAVEVSDMVRTVSAAPRLTDFTADAKDAFKRGAIAGKIFSKQSGSNIVHREALIYRGQKRKSRRDLAKLSKSECRKRRSTTACGRLIGVYLLSGPRGCTTGIRREGFRAIPQTWGCFWLRPTRLGAGERRRARRSRQRPRFCGKAIHRDPGLDFPASGPP